MPVIRKYRSGVWCIANASNSKKYVGASTVSAINGYKYCLWCLKAGICHNFSLQMDWDEYGESSFRTFILERCKPNECVLRKQFWMNKLKVRNYLYGYNIKLATDGILGKKYLPRAEKEDKYPRNAAEYRTIRRTK